MAKTIVGMYKTLTAARKVVSDLQESGVKREDISLIAGDIKGDYARYFDTTNPPLEDEVMEDAGSGAAAGAGTGAVLGGVAGLLVGLGVLAIPGIGPVVAAGPILSALTGAGIGAATGGLAGALVNAGVPTDVAERYASGVRGGDAIVIVHTSDDMTDTLKKVMDQYNPIQVSEPTEGQMVNDAKVMDMNNENADLRSQSFEFHHEGTSLDHQVERIRAASDSNDTNQEPSTSTSQTPMTTEADDEPVGAGRMLYTHEGLVDRSQLPADMLPQTPAPMGDALESTGPDAIDDDFHDHYDAHYATSDFEYVQYEPAYQYGYDLAGEPRYRDYDWNHIESQARTDWEQTHTGSVWDQFRDAVRFGWDLRRGMSR